jgi:hypothetical protein
MSYAAGDVIGWQEEGILMPEHASVRVQLDTGTEGSSLAASNILPFDREGEKWVRFTVQAPKGPAGAMVPVVFERKIDRSAKSKGAIGGGGKRQVVSLNICIGKHVYTEEVAIKDSAKIDAPLILGRTALQHFGPVDVTRVSTVKPDCAG